MYDFSINDLVTFFGRIVGQVIYITGSLPGTGNWAGVRDSQGRVDEYPASMLHRAR